MKSSAATLLLVIALPSLLVAWDWQRQWEDGLIESSLLLKKGDYQKALPLLKRMTRQMVDRIGPGDAAAHLFSIVLTHRAIAEAGSGNYDEALWYWDVALSLYPSLARSDTSMFGAPGQFLKNNLARDSSLVYADEIPGAEPPRVKSRKRPEFPQGAARFGVEGTLVVEAVITKKGSVTAPRVVKGLAAPTLSFAAFEAMKAWKFEPAKSNGEPIDVLFQLTVEYKIYD